MKKKLKKEMTYSEAAEFFTSLAGRLAEGTVGLDRHGIEITGGTVFVEAELKRKGEGVELTVELKGEHTTSSKRDSRPHPSRGEKGRRGAKHLKKAVAALWKVIKRDIQAGRMPASRDVGDIKTAMEGYGRLARPQWSVQWLKCAGLVEECLSQAEKGDFSKAMEAAREVDRLTKECHKEYK